VHPPAIVAQITGSNRCDTEGLTATGHAPVLGMCRKLLEAGSDPARPLEAYRGEVLCLTVSSIVHTIDENRSLRLVRWKPYSGGGGSSRIAPAEVDA
jgi:hypothetical protein